MSIDSPAPASRHAGPPTAPTPPESAVIGLDLDGDHGRGAGAEEDFVEPNQCLDRGSHLQRNEMEGGGDGMEGAMGGWRDG